MMCLDCDNTQLLRIKHFVPESFDTQINVTVALAKAKLGSVSMVVYITSSYVFRF